MFPLTALPAAAMYVPRRAASIPSPGFPCVYLTSSTRAAEMAATLLDSAQIRIHRSPTLNRAKAALQATRSRVLLTDVAFERGGWEDALQMAARMPLRTALVLVSRLADERLWIDALERGAYDLILEPFHADELRRILGNAHLHATSGTSLPAAAPRLAANGNPCRGSA